jgi:hypothetical protein
LVFPEGHALHHVVSGQDFDIVAHGWFSPSLLSHLFQKKRRRLLKKTPPQF